MGKDQNRLGKERRQERNLLNCTHSYIAISLTNMKALCFSVNSAIKNQISLFFSNDSKYNEKETDFGAVDKFAKAFLVELGKAFEDCGYASPFSSNSQQKVVRSVLNANKTDTAFSSMIFMEKYDGTAVPKVMKTLVSAFPNHSCLIIKNT